MRTGIHRIGSPLEGHRTGDTDSEFCFDMRQVCPRWYSMPLSWWIFVVVVAYVLVVVSHVVAEMLLRNGVLCLRATLNIVCFFVMAAPRLGAESWGVCYESQGTCTVTTGDSLLGELVS